MAVKDPPDGFINDPGTGEQQQSGFDERGKILELAMTILVVSICWLIRDAYGQERNNGGNQVQTRVGSFGENSQAAGRRPDDDLESCNCDSRKDRVPRHAPLLG